MEQLANFVTKSFEYNNNRVLEMINAKQADDKMDRISNSDTNPDIIDEEDDESVDIEITDLSTSSTIKSESSLKCSKISKNLECDNTVKLSKSLKNSKDDDSEVEICDKNSVKLINTNGLIEKNSSTSPIPLIKKHITKNWLISDVAKRKPESNCRPKTLNLTTFNQISNLMQKFSFPLLFSADQENANALNLIRIEDLVNKKQSVSLPFRPKPVTELLKQIREIDNKSPILQVDSKSEKFKTEIDEDKFKQGEWFIKIF